MILVTMWIGEYVIHTPFLPEIGRKDDGLGGRRRGDKGFVDVMKE
jgi:hypothetical protein